MTFRQFAFNNVTRNKRLYAAYFLSSLFTVMVFFTFANFAFHPALTGDALNESVTLGLGVAGGIIYLFSFFFIMYSMSSFLQSRKREFGLLMMQGMSTRQIRFMVFLENMLIGLSATISGIFLGLIFSKGILLLAENVLVIDEELSFYFPLMPIIATFLSFLILFLFISVLVTFILRSNKLIELIKGKQQSKGEPKASILLTMTAVILLGGGYFTALYAKGMAVFMVMVPVVIVVIIGTYLLFTQLSVYLIGKLRKRKRVFWRKTNMILLSDLAFRMKDNARTFFMVAIISTVAFSAIGTLIGFQSFLTDGIKASAPYSLLYTDYKDDKEEFVANQVKQVDHRLDEEKVTYRKEAIDLQYYSSSDGDSTVMITNESDYNRFATLTDRKAIQLEDDQSVVVGPNTANMMQEENSEDKINQPFKLEDGMVVKPTEKLEPNVLPELQSFYIVSDQYYKALPQAAEQVTYYAWQADSGQSDQVLDASETLTEEIEGHALYPVDYTVYEINKMYGPIMFVGLFIGIVFFVSAGSFLYFRLYTDLDDDKEKFKSIAKMGLTNRELTTVINRQTAILFFAPIIVALIHGAVALTALSHMFNYSLFQESAYVLGSFLVIQCGYFLVVRAFYTKQIKRAIQ